MDYVSGYIAKQIKTIQHCEECKYILCKDTKTEWHELMVQKEYHNKILQKFKYCTPDFIRAICEMYNIIMYVLPKICHTKKAILKLTNYLERNISFNFPILCKLEMNRTDHRIDLD